MNEKETGIFIAEMRKKKNMTQRELAEQVNVSDKTISKWETGKSLPDISYLKTLCEALDITVNELLAGQKLSQQDYSLKAEETIMSLIKENENNKTKNHFMSIIGIALVLITTILLFINTPNGYEGLRIFPIMYLDIPSLIQIALPAIGIVLITKKRDYLQILKLLDKILIPIGVISTLASFVIMIVSMSDPSTIGPNLAVCSLSLLYAFIAKIIVIILINRKS